MPFDSVDWVDRGNGLESMFAYHVFTAELTLNDSIIL